MVKLTFHKEFFNLVCFFLTSGICVTNLSSSFAQLVDPKSYVVIPPESSESEIIRRAAGVVPSERQLRWQRLELTAFIHFGVNTFTNREWGDGKEDPAIFNPSELDARQWVRTCKEAGFKQVILTAKHHDGFCLWPSKYTEHSIKKSPWKAGKGDVVKDVADACHEYGIGFGVYLSPWDRNSGLFGTDAYNDYFVNQLTELLSGYGRVDEVWFDGANGEGPEGKKQVYDFNRWYSLIRKLQPSAVIAVMGPDVRWVGIESGYGRETEWSVVPGDELVQDKVAASSQKEAGFAPMNMMDDDLGSRSKILKAKSLVWYPAEIDVSIRPGWFYHPEEDDKVKSPDKLMDIYFSSVGRNGVLLLNIPPDKRGLLHDSDVKALLGFRKSLDKAFERNLLTKAVVKTSGKKINVLTDKNDTTSWTPKASAGTAVIDIKLEEMEEFNMLLLQEDIRKGQRVEQFSLEYFADGEWKKATSGTTVGYKRILRFPVVRADRLRLKIEASRAKAVIAEAGIFKFKVKS